MKVIFFLILLFALTPSYAFSSDSTGVVRTLVPNKISDRYYSSGISNLNGFLGYRLKANLERRLLQIDSGTILSGVRKKPGAQTWIGEHTGKFLFSAAKTYSYCHDQRLKHLMDDVAKKYISYQLPNGYLGTYLPKDYWTAWDVWSHKYAIIGLLSYYEATGSQQALKAASKAGNLICDIFGIEPGKLDLMLSGEHKGLASGSILGPMIDLYRYTGNKRYLDFCKYIIDSFEEPQGPHLFSRLAKYSNVTKVGDAKAYEMLSCLLGVIKYYELTGEEKYFITVKTAWSDIVQNRLYITGTSSDHETFQNKDNLMAENSNDMGEGCVTVTWLQLNLKLLQITGEKRYLAELERSVYNHLLAAENPNMVVLVITLHCREPSPIGVTKDSPVVCLVSLGGFRLSRK